MKIKILLQKVDYITFENHPNGYDTGTSIEGDMSSFPEVGKLFWCGNVHTSKVTEIIDHCTFKTLNSVYKFTILRNER